MFMKPLNHHIVIRRECSQLIIQLNDQVKAPKFLVHPNILQKHKKTHITPKPVHITWRTFIAARRFFIKPKNLGENKMSRLAMMKVHAWQFLGRSPKTLKTSVVHGKLRHPNHIIAHNILLITHYSK